VVTVKTHRTFQTDFQQLAASTAKTPLAAPCGNTSTARKPLTIMEMAFFLHPGRAACRRTSASSLTLKWWLHVSTTAGSDLRLSIYGKVLRAALITNKQGSHWVKLTRHHRHPG